MRRIVLAAVAVIFAQQGAYAAVSCPDKAPVPILSAGAAGLKCQETIAREGGKFLRAKMATMTACKLKFPAGTCPRVQESDKLNTLALKAADKIAAACGDDTAQAALATSYGAGTDPAVISSCMLSQHNVVGEYVVANAVGPTAEVWPATGAERSLCVKEVAKWGRLAAAKFLTNASVCIKKAMKDGVAGDLGPLCIGSYSGGAFVPPTDATTATKQGKVFALIEDKLDDKCGPAEPLGYIATMFGCAGSTSVADLKECVLCAGWDAAVDAAGQQYGETGTYVPHSVGGLQAAVSAASAGDKLLIGSGTYVEEVLVTQDNLQLVGCGGATNQRPLIEAPAVEVSGRGLDANGVDGLVFQSLGVKGQDNDGIRVTSCEGVVFRDIVADGSVGGVPASAYSVFPRTCNNVLVELCKVAKVNDAPIYVGQSSGIVVRHNEVRESVAGIEIENCGNAQVYGNYATNNTAGILVFKDGSLPIQLSECHQVNHNVLEGNNAVNIGSGTVAAVPQGTGILIVSNDTTTFHHNISRGNSTFGIALTDQPFAEFGPPFSVDFDPTENYMYANILADNGFDSHAPLSLAGDAVAIVSNVAPNTLGNCQANNLFGPIPTEIGFNSLPTCTLPAPSPFATCPAPSVPTP